MRHYFFIFFILFPFYFQPQALFNQSQKDHSKTLSSSLSYEIMDLFYTASFDVSYRRINFSSSIGCGLNRTIYQGQFFPQVQLGATHLTMKKSNFFFGPELVASYSILRVFELHHFSGLRIGYHLRYGCKWFLVHRLNAGIINERYKNVLNQYSSASTLNYQLSIGLGYAL